MSTRTTRKTAGPRGKRNPPAPTPSAANTKDAVKSAAAEPMEVDPEPIDPIARNIELAHKAAAEARAKKMAANPDLFKKEVKEEEVPHIDFIPAEVEAVISEENEDSDQIVREIPIYLTHQLASYLHLFQYPVRNLGFTPETGPIAARLKPKARLIELDLPLHTESPLYDKERGEELSLGTSDRVVRTAYDRMETEEDKKELLEKQTLSSQLVPAAARYMVGVLREDELHLTPIHGSVQLRPNLNYLDKIDEKYKAATKRITDEESKDEEQPQPSTSKAKSISVSVKSANPEQTTQKSPYTRASRFAENEPWTKLQYFDETTEQSEIIFQQMLSRNRAALRCVTTPQQFLESISVNK
ncbi:uncharacterized protein VTP21DRAFT_1408 [Calcarisporiella thermophila]|uniref:uncharacterized protein n=1 Tax=Calcarisporiella thermophila TaxID=911321 RepID=UPI0037434D72